MNFRKLSIFYETALNLNMTKVAKKLYISQPSISQAISEIEQELNVKLFDRINKRLYLTHEGEIYLNYARRILNLQQEAIEAIESINKGEKGKIVIGASTTIGAYILPNFIRKFSEEYRGIEISIIIENTKHIEGLLLENKIDFAFVEGQVYSNEIVKETIWKDDLIFIASSDNKINKIKEPDLKIIEDYKIIMREEGSGTRDIVEVYLNSNNINYNIAMQIGHSEAIASIVEAGIGLGCISYKCVEEKIKNGTLKKVNFKNFNLRRDLYLVKHKDKLLNPNMLTFIDEIKKVRI
ncbi:DNA-binding transcriptional regulator, LysR family [Clostridium cavendishii DSM 21758]|uniref:DNA-binding transcriptional regulator, LysR family n=1 Tax=Clostridium cavendishii DSM 21758 TaxID=1121302 RepID=A0A1M6CVB8_9CLOT|nr:LysR family transcriptional regulator [Clostridium cavendishii]SHI64967.1 DNA-binding transcriptional regulator, LysR family [Clostridium cavendishii DSM 21758]